MHRDPLPKCILLTAVLALGIGVYATNVSDAADRSANKTFGINQIENVVVIYAETAALIIFMVFSQVRMVSNISLAK
jgi:hypothetical protein